jgi:hypothetical protein
MMTRAKATRRARNEAPQRRVRATRARGGSAYKVRLDAEKELATTIRAQGALYHDGTESYLFLNDGGRLYRLHPGDDGLRLWLAEFGILVTEQLGVQVVEALRLRALDEGKETTVHFLAHYQKDSGRLFVSEFGGTMVVVSPGAERPQRRSNGYDGVLFLNPPGAESVDLLDGPTLTDPRQVLDAIVGGLHFEGDVLTPKDQAALLLAYVLGLFFPDLFPTRVILALIGEKGSGKTSALRRIGRLLFGPGFEVAPLTRDERDFDALVTNSPFVVFDNVDTGPPWLNDRMAMLATGAQIGRRELYSTNRQVTFPIRAFAAVTSRTPPFRRDDLAERLLPLRLGRRPSFVPERALLDEVARQRPAILRALLPLLHHVVNALRHNPALEEASAHRMADFAGFFRVIGQLIPLTDPETTLARLTASQAEFSIEADPALPVLEAWLRVPGNLGREVRAAEWVRELRALAGSVAGSKVGVFDSAHTLAVWAKQHWALLERRYGARSRVRAGGYRWYRFTSAPDLDDDSVSTASRLAPIVEPGAGTACPEADSRLAADSPEHLPANTSDASEEGEL